jgi:predicted ATPase
VHHVSSLDIPDAAAPVVARDALTYSALTVFVDRAALADTRFVLTDDTAPIVADICRRLDGIPLAIELAAARVKVLSIPNLAQRLNERFKILTGGSRTALPRQQTLSALIDWSYDLLTPTEQMLFNRLGIFAGAFSLSAAEAVCTGDGVEDIDVLDLLASLTDKSLVVAATSGEQERYHLNEFDAQGPHRPTRCDTPRHSRIPDDRSCLSSASTSQWLPRRGAAQRPDDSRQIPARQN